jgi:hypothetical protein
MIQYRRVYKDIPIILDTIPRCLREPVSVGKYMNENIDRCELLDGGRRGHG